MQNNEACGRRYDREFKDNAVALVRGGRNISRVARDLGVSQWSVAAGWPRPMVDSHNASQRRSPPRARSNASYGVYARKTTTCANKGTS